MSCIISHSIYSVHSLRKRAQRDSKASRDVVESVVAIPYVGPTLHDGRAPSRYPGVGPSIENVRDCATYSCQSKAGKSTESQRKLRPRDECTQRLTSLYAFVIMPTFTPDRSLLNPKFDGYKFSPLGYDEVTSHYPLEHKLSQTNASGRAPLSFQEVQSRVLHNHLTICSQSKRAVYVDAELRIVGVDLDEVSSQVQAVYARLCS